MVAADTTSARQGAALVNIDFNTLSPPLWLSCFFQRAAGAISFHGNRVFMPRSGPTQPAPRIDGRPVIVVQTPTDSAVAIAASYAAKVFAHPKSSSQVTLRWREPDSNLRSRVRWSCSGCDNAWLKGAVDQRRSVSSTWLGLGAVPD